MSGIGHGHEGFASSARPAFARPVGDAPIAWAAASEGGPARRHNEDRWAADVAGGVFALADGMGGYNAGEVAAEIAVRTVAQGVTALREAGLSIADALARAVATAHAGIVDYARTRPECLGMATTLVAAAVDGDALTVVHVGDSRAYLLRDGVLRRLTADHSVGQQMLEAGRLTESQVRRMPSRGILTRALGIASEPPLVDVFRGDWRVGDLLLLCSDGLTDALDDAGIARAAAADSPLHDRARALLAAALSQGGTDDSTVLLAGDLRAAAFSH
jgi:protein phosphatase